MEVLRASGPMGSDVMHGIQVIETEPTGFALLARAMGIAARRQGETALVNPFADEPSAFTAWLDGWMSATQIACAA